MWCYSINIDLVPRIHHRGFVRFLLRLSTPREEADDDELVQAVRLAAVGESYLNPKLGARIAAEPPPGAPDDLSEREADVLRLIALGHTNAEIAAQLYLSVRTVETHRSHIQQKLRLSTRAELVGDALERGLISAGG